MKIILKNISDSIIDACERAELSGRSVQEIQVNMSELNELRDLFPFGSDYPLCPKKNSIVGKFNGITLRYI